MCVSESQVKEIVHDEIHTELKPIRKEVNSAKNWAIGTLLALLATMFGIGAWVGNIESRVETVEEDQTRFEDRIEQKLTRIENLIIELTRETNK